MAKAEIELEFPDGGKKKFAKGITGAEIAKGIGEGLARAALSVKVDGQVLDLSRPIEKGGKFEVLTEKSGDGLKTLWHSTSHVMAEAVLELFPEAKPTIGPSIDEGFYYDFDVKKPFSHEDLEKIEAKMKEIIKKDEQFERREISRREALDLFKANKYKAELIKELPEGETISIYTDGDFTDLCSGPHITNTGRIKAVKLLKSSGAYWRGSEKNRMLQRIYGISFPDEKRLKAFVAQKEEAAKRNHIKLGKELDLFSMQEEAPGCVFFHPNGMVLWNELMKLWYEEHFRAGYGEIKTPEIMKRALWEKSGHWDHYKDNMYFTKIDDEDFAVKPMNCPGGILVFKSKRHSYRDLPLRLAEVGTVHRHEKSGVLNGLFRVRRFTQDDAHLYCTEDQIMREVKGIIGLIDKMYSVFGFTYHVELSTRPEKAMGSKETWDHAEGELKKALDEAGVKFRVNEGDGAFYGPKIDFHINDSLGRTWQCATIQLDYQMPEKFELAYIGKDDKEHRPIMLHRVVYGSVERFIGILIEHFGGNFPLWLAPVQVKVLPVSDKFNAYAKKVHEELMQNFIRSELDDRQETVSYKVRDAELRKIPFTVTVGGREEEAETVAVRGHDGKVAVQKLDAFIALLAEKIAKRENA